MSNLFHLGLLDSDTDETPSNWSQLVISSVMHGIVIRIVLIVDTNSQDVPPVSVQEIKSIHIEIVNCIKHRYWLRRWWHKQNWSKIKSQPEPCYKVSNSGRILCNFKSGTIKQSSKAFPKIQNKLNPIPSIKTSLSRILKHILESHFILIYQEKDTIWKLCKFITFAHSAPEQTLLSCFFFIDPILLLPICSNKVMFISSRRKLKPCFMSSRYANNPVQHK